MAEKRFGMGEAIRFGWETMKENIWFFIPLLIIAFLIKSVPGAIAEYAGSEFPVISTVLWLSGLLLGYVVDMGLVKISLQFCDGVKGKFDDLLSSFDILIPFIVASILYGLIIFGGFLLLVVPSIIWGIQFSLYPYFIVEKKLGPIEALKASSRATMGAKWDLFLFGLLLGLINFAGMLVFLVGLFATIPTSMVAYAYVYRRLTGEPEPTGLTYEV
ncbi:MAG TPA: hypothetical protein ENH45_01250 [Nitrospirae bacterium]|nr:hypothetical protein BMS3Abin09_01307 [bacterium BMS3Abin09]HDZ83820.1 hypothetical protein [Nitrospirota bacterium]